jgi:uncharacterized protein YjeT (DUF2065 family)
MTDTALDTRLTPAVTEARLVSTARLRSLGGFLIVLGLVDLFGFGI